MSEEAEEVRFIEATGKDVESAVSSGLARLGLKRSDVIVEVLDEGSTGFFGLGGRNSTVRITPMVPVEEEQEEAAPAKEEPQVPRREAPQRQPRAEKLAPAGAREEKPQPPAPPQEEKPQPPKEQVEADEEQLPADADTDEKEVVLEIIGNLMEKLEADVTYSAYYSMPDELTGRQMLMVDIQGDDVSALIGSRGESLNAMQYIVRLMAGHRLQRRVNVAVDVAGYRERREKALTRLAERMAGKAVRRKRPVTLEPMSPAERRIVHMTLRNSDDVYTNSVGEGDRRRVRIYPKNGENGDNSGPGGGSGRRNRRRSGGRRRNDR
jgi:spoIIIJ-associated protein